jgi:hypothetical protein
MKRFVQSLIMPCLVCLAFISCTRQTGTNASFRPGEIWNDSNGIPVNAHGGGILYHSGTYYWFGQHMVEGEAGNRAEVGVHCYSSGDLYNWKDEGIALKVEEDSSSDIVRGCILERPKVIYNPRTRKFVMWFHLELKDRGYSSARAGVAVSERVQGPYTFIRSFRSNAGQWPVNVEGFHKKPASASLKGMVFSGGDLPADADSLNLLGRDFQGGQMVRDMTLFVDDDGKAYHLFASEENSTLHISELSDDYTSYSGRFIRVFAGRFMEAPALFKKDSLYYFIGSGCTGWNPNAARSAVAPSIWGPWEELGNPCAGTDSALTFHSQGTFFLPVAGRKNAFIFMADRWNPENAIDGRHVWLPVRFEGRKILLKWMDEWDLSDLD